MRNESTDEAISGCGGLSEDDRAGCEFVSEVSGRIVDKLIEID